MHSLRRLSRPGSRHAAHGAAWCCLALAAGVAAQPVAAPAPGAVVTPQRLTATEAANPYVERALGLLARPRFAASKAGAFSVEVLDLMVGPGKSTSWFRLPGAVVVEVRAGSGTLSADGKPRSVATGQVEAFDDGASLQFINTQADEPLILRATLIGAAP